MHSSCFCLEPVCVCVCVLVCIPACGRDSKRVFGVSVCRHIGVPARECVCVCVFTEDSPASVTSSLKDAWLAGPQSSLPL